MEQNTSHYRIRTELPPFAGLAVFADPHVVELVHRLLYDFGVICEHLFDIFMGFKIR